AAETACTMSLSVFRAWPRRSSCWVTTGCGSCSVASTPAVAMPISMVCSGSARSSSCWRTTRQALHVRSAWRDQELEEEQLGHPLEDQGLIGDDRAIDHSRTAYGGVMPRAHPERRESHLRTGTVGQVDRWQQNGEVVRVGILHRIDHDRDELAQHVRGLDGNLVATQVELDPIRPERERGLSVERCRGIDDLDPFAGEPVRVC